VVYVVVFAVLVFLGGLVVLGMMGVRLWRSVRSLGRTVAAAGAQVAEASAALETIAPRDR
jgi:hypothetical protein